MTEPHGLRHDHRKRFQFQDCRVATDAFSGFLLVACAPINIFNRLAVRNRARRGQSLLFQPERDPLPGIKITLQCQRTLAVPLQVFWNPGVPAFTFTHWLAMMFLGFHFGAKRFCLLSLIWTVSAKTDRK